MEKREKKRSESEIIKILNAHAFMHNFTPTDVGVLLLKMCKIS